MARPAERVVRIGRTVIGNDRPLVWIAGPCVMESPEFTVRTARRLAELARRRRVPFIFKSSFDKANRSSIRSFRGPGLARGLAILERIKEEVGCPVLTDVHEPLQVAAVARVADVLQVPAFLCRQTDLLVACAKSGRAVNVKKGQFLAPWDMKAVIEKITSAGPAPLMLTERGSSFGYNNLVVDMRSLAVMKSFGCPVIYDATHSVQLPGGLGHASGGQREFAAPLARAAAGLGVAGIFTEVHPDPDRALSDGPNSLSLKSLPAFLDAVCSIDRTVKSL